MGKYLSELYCYVNEFVSFSTIGIELDNLTLQIIQYFVSFF